MDNILIKHLEKLEKLTNGNILVIFLSCLFLVLFGYTWFLIILIPTFFYLAYRIIFKNIPLLDCNCKLKITPVTRTFYSHYSQTKQNDGRIITQIRIRIKFNNINNNPIKVISYSITKPKIKFPYIHFNLEDPETHISHDINNLTIPSNFTGFGSILIITEDNLNIEKEVKKKLPLKVKLTIIDSNSYKQKLIVFCKLLET